MLDELHVHNYAIIDKLQVRFTEGLNILSGETGAGKSILVGALGLLLGDKTDTSIIRSGSEETAVSGIVSLSGQRGSGAMARRPRHRARRRRGHSAPHAEVHRPRVHLHPVHSRDADRPARVFHAPFRPARAARAPVPPGPGEPPHGWWTAGPARRTWRSDSIPCTPCWHRCGNAFRSS